MHMYVHTFIQASAIDTYICIWGWVISWHRHVTRQLAEGRHTVDATDDDGGMLDASCAVHRAVQQQPGR